MKVPRHHGGLRLPRLRRRLAVAVSVVAVFGLIGSAAAASPDPGGAPPALVSLTQTDLAQLAAGTPASVPLTLLTGDTVQVSLDEAGNPTVQEMTAAPRPGGTPVAFHTLTSHGDTFVVPDDALPLLSEDLLDWDLFNLRELAKVAAYGTVGGTPLLVTHPAAAAQSVPMVGASGGRQLSGIDATALTVDGRSWWPALVRAGAEPATLAAGPLAGVEKIWLDGIAEIALDESVPQVGAPVAWERGFDGTGVTVAVLDTGIDATHPDLAGQLVEAVDFTGNPDGPVDGNGHGTHVAATIAGTGAGSDGLRPGVAPGADLLIGKVCGDNGGCPDSAILDGMAWAAQSGAPVVSMSLGGGPTDGTDPLSQAVNDLSAAHGTLFVIAAGNNGPSGQTIGAPGAADAALTVAAVDKQDRIATFSSRGPRRGDLAPKPDIAAPGVGIVAARAAGTTMGTPVDELYTAANGTSMATPHVSGAAAILAQQSPDLTGEQLKALLMSTAVDLGQRPTAQGSGRLDVSRAIDPSVFVAGSGAFGRQRFPHQPVTRNLAYHNVTDEPVTLTLTGSVSGPDGAPVPDGLLTLSQTEITVPAGGSTPVSAVLDGSLLGEDGPFGDYRGSIDAVDADGELRSRTVVGAFLEPQRFRLTIEMVPPDGASDLAAAGWFGIPVDDQTELQGPAIPLVRDGQTDLFPGSYSFISQAITWRDPDGWLNQAVVAAPEVTVTDGPVTVRLDLRRLEPVTVRTPEPTEVHQSAISVQRASVNEDWRTGSILRLGDGNEPTRWWTLPAGPPTLGSFDFTTSHVLVPPMLTMLTFGQGAARIHPRYATADLTVPAGSYFWTEGDTDVVRQIRLPVPRLATRGPTRLVDAGAGLPADLAAARLDGAVALIRPADLCPVGEVCDFAALRERVAGAAERGAVAVLVAGQQGWVRFAPSQTTTVECPDGPDSCPPVQPYAPIPILRISADEADGLIARLDRGTVRALAASRSELPRAYLLSFHSPDRVPDGLPYRVGHRDLDRVEHRFHADQPGQVTAINWLRVQQSGNGLRMPLPLVATQRTLTALVQHDPETVHVQEVQTAPYVEPHLLDLVGTETYENHAYVVDGGWSTEIGWNLGPIVPGTGEAPTTRSGFQPNISFPCPGCRERDVLYPTMFLTTADGHKGEFVGVVNDTGLTRRLFGIIPCEPPDCRIRLYDEAGNELEQTLVTVRFGIGGGLSTTEEANR